jgi:hypothetical protein
VQGIYFEIINHILEGILRVNASKILPGSASLPVEEHHNDQLDHYIPIEQHGSK